MQLVNISYFVVARMLLRTGTVFINCRPGLRPQIPPPFFLSPFLHGNLISLFIAQASSSGLRERIAANSVSFFMYIKKAPPTRKYNIRVMEASYEHVLSLHALLPKLYEVIMEGGDEDVSLNNCFCTDGEEGGLWAEADEVILSVLEANNNLKKECQIMRDSVTYFCEDIITRDNIISDPQRGGSSIKAKSKRSTFTASQKKILEMWYKKVKFPTAEDKADITALTQLTIRKVEDWFNNRRKRTK